MPCSRCWSGLTPNIVTEFANASHLSAKCNYPTDKSKYQIRKIPRLPNDTRATCLLQYSSEIVQIPSRGYEARTLRYCLCFDSHGEQYYTSWVPLSTSSYTSRQVILTASYNDYVGGRCILIVILSPPLLKTQQLES